MCIRDRARTFHEGLQAITTVISAIQLESNGHGVCVGRLDQLLYPYYKQELEAGTLTQESAMELVCALYIKLNEQSKLRDIYDTKPFVGYMTYPNLTIAGQDDAGRDGVNDLSYICVAATKKSRLIQPLLAVRVFNGTSHRFMQECAKCVGTGIGYPAFYNDEAIIPAMMAVGYSLDDARGYGIVGCVEPSIPGKCSGRYGAAFPNPVKVLECTINGGTDPRTGLTPLPCKRLSEMSSWEEFYNEFKAQELHYLKHHVIQDNCIDKVYEQYLQTPLLSSYVQDCIGRGKELKQDVYKRQGFDYYDAVKPFIRSSAIDVIIGQSLPNQAYDAVKMMFYHLCYGVPLVNKDYNSRLDVIVSSNMDYFEG